MIQLGHDVTLIAPRSSALFARAAGLPVVLFGAAEELKAQRDPKVLLDRFCGMASWRTLGDKYLSRLVEDYESMVAIIDGLAPDLVVGHPLAPVGSLAAETLDIPYAVLHLYPQLEHHSRLGRRRSFGGSLASAIWEVEQKERLTPSNAPLFDRGSSNRCVTSVHDPVLVEGSRLRTMQIGLALGFPYMDSPFDGDKDGALIGELDPDGPPVVLVSLGSFLGAQRVDVLARVINEVHGLGWQALVLGVPPNERRRLSHRLTICTGFLATSYAAPHVDVVVHHGGIGTTYGVLRAGKPSVVWPQAFDQRFNALLLQEVGAGVLVSSSTELRSAILKARREGVASSTRIAGGLLTSDSAALKHATQLLGCI